MVLGNTQTMKAPYLAAILLGPPCDPLTLAPGSGGDLSPGASVQCSCGFQDLFGPESTTGPGGRRASSPWNGGGWGPGQGEMGTLDIEVSQVRFRLGLGYAGLRQGFSSKTPYPAPARYLG